ncbi:thiolase domain-containing protein [Aquibium oceanicum]|uniref:Acetyl-CoA acetyltransferase n=1 Tax=Aquibium oceanicum TaxID=1670800 RepID=A0A1L3SWN7_9HYPH|nr:thiolase domain-containing protein [Aquibium oceanicum]APH73732.1 acetyl-CoA acetyltransferase [Aquibium oceanicum]
MARYDARIIGAFEHPTRFAPDKSIVQLHAECAIGAATDAGIDLSEVDGYFCAADAPGLGALSVMDYLNLTPRYADATELGGASYVAHVGRAARAIDAGLCNVALITLAGKPRSANRSSSAAALAITGDRPERDFEVPFGPTTPASYALCAARHMHEYGTTSEQLAWIKVAASRHAAHNPNAWLKDAVTVDDVMASPMIASPLHRLDCCVVTDGGGALILARPEVARTLGRPSIRVLGCGEGIKHQGAGELDLTYTAAVHSGPVAFAESGLEHRQIQYASIYDSFTITVLLALEDLGFCKKGQGGSFVEGGNLISGIGMLPFNTDGGGLCNNHPANRGGMTKVVEAVRQLRGEAHPALQVPDCRFALCHGTGGALGTRHGCATLILSRED